MSRPELKEIATRKVVELINWFHFHKAGFASKEHPEVIDTMSEILALLIPDIEADKNIIVELADKQVKGWIEEAKKQERERIYKEGYPQHYYPAHLKVWAKTIVERDGYVSGLAAFLEELSERWQALKEGK